LKILILDPSDLSSFGSGQIKKLLLTLLAFKILNFEILLITYYKSIVIQLNIMKVSTQSIFIHVKKISLLRNLRPRTLSDILVMLFVTFKYLLSRKYSSFDVVLLEHYNFAFLIPILRLLRRFTPIIYDAHAVEYELVTSVLSKIVVPIHELMAVRHSDIIIVLSKADALQLNHLYKVPLNKITVIPLPMINKLPKSLSNTMVQELKRKHKEKLAQLYGNDILYKPVIVFHGSLKYTPNKEAVDFIINALAPKFSDSIFIIVGPDPPYIGRRGNVIFTGFVKNISEILLACDVAIIPVKRVTGVNMKVYDYIAHGLPIIASRLLLRWFDRGSAEGTIIFTSLDSFEQMLRQVLKKGYINTRWRVERTLKDYAQDYALAILKALKVQAQW
jgi:hypothetical protein